MTIRWEREDSLQEYADRIFYDQIVSRRREQEALLDREHWHRVRGLLERLPEPAACKASVSYDDCLQIAEENRISDEDRALLYEVLEAMLPWRKGPFTLAGEEVDAEWRSDIKWNRIVSALDQTAGKRILDIGCNNGYYMLKLAASNPRLVVGIDPSERCWYQFELLQRFVQDKRLVYELLGVDDVSLFPKLFDVVLCMGVIYHHRNPLQMLKTIQDCMIPGGQLLLESLVVPEEGSYALCPPDRYAKMRNVYFIPTTDCMRVWLERSGYADVALVSYEEVTEEEQRSTRLAPYWSLKDYLDPEDPTRTIEGYAAPYRAAFSARKRR